MKKRLRGSRKANYMACSFVSTLRIIAGSNHSALDAKISNAIGAGTYCRPFFFLINEQAILVKSGTSKDHVPGSGLVGGSSAPMTEPLPLCSNMERRSTKSCLRIFWAGISTTTCPLTND
jgi:hypothetical protein